MISLTDYIEATVKLSDKERKNNGSAKLLLIALLKLRHDKQDIYAYGAFIGANKQYKEIENILIKEGIFAYDNEVILNSLSKELDRFLGYLSMRKVKEIEKILNLNKLLKDFNKKWAGLKGLGATGFEYSLLDSIENKKALFTFTSNNPEITEDTIIKATAEYISKTEKDFKGRIKYGMKSNNFITKKLEEYCNIVINRKNKADIEEPRFEGNSYYSDI